MSAKSPSGDDRSRAFFGDVDPEAIARLEQLRALAPSVPRYAPGEEIARGGMGAIVRVVDEALGREVAMKVSLTARAGDSTTKLPTSSGTTIRRFIEEALITARIRHPGVVPIHDLGIDAEGRLYFTMRLIDGTTFREVIEWVRQRERGFPLARAIAILRDACDAVACAHRQRIVHRDLKPTNLMIGPFGEAYVMDWGLARRLGGRAESAAENAVGGGPVAGASDPAGAGLGTLEGAIVGTPAYMSPEQAAGRHGELDPRSDVYAMGAILYHLLAGEPPYAELATDGRASRTSAVIEAARSRPPRRLVPDARRAPRELVAICEQAMARAPEQRYQDLAAMGADLRAFLERRVVRAHRTGAVAEFSKWVARNRFAAILAGVALTLLVAGLVGVRWLTERKNHELDEERAWATRTADDVSRLSALKQVHDLIARADTIWPIAPERAPDMRQWIDEARDLARRRPEHAAALAQLDAGDASAHRSERLLAWWRESMAELDSTLASLAALEPRRVGTIAEMERRAGLAATITARSIDGFAGEWSEAILAIAADPRYRGLELVEQLGLVPIGQDPASGLFEFWQIETGAMPRRDVASGRLLMEDEIGLVMVLLPGDEALEIEPFFLSKFEVTRAQWQSLTGVDPCAGTDDAVPASNARPRLEPAEIVSFNEAVATLARIALVLPTGREWEYACRAGTTTRFWTGDDPLSIAGAANLADQTYADGFPTLRGRMAPWRDGFEASSPVGSFRANAFGLHDVMGNVSEYCDDEGSDPAGGPLPRMRMTRGGNYTRPYSAAASEAVEPADADSNQRKSGMRPARRIVR